MYSVVNGLVRGVSVTNLRREKVGVHQGSVLSPQSFIVMLDALSQ